MSFFLHFFLRKYILRVFIFFSCPNCLFSLERPVSTMSRTNIEYTESGPVRGCFLLPRSKGNCEGSLLKVYVSIVLSKCVSDIIASILDSNPKISLQTYMSNGACFMHLSFSVVVLCSLFLYRTKILLSPQDKSLTMSSTAILFFLYKCMCEDACVVHTCIYIPSCKCMGKKEF